MPMLPEMWQQAGNLLQQAKGSPEIQQQAYQAASNSFLPMQVKGAGVPGSRSFGFDKVRQMLKPGEEEFMTRRFGMQEDEWVRAIAEDRVRNAIAARNFGEVSKVSKDLANMGKAYAKAREQVVKLLMTIKNPMVGGK